MLWPGLESLSSFRLHATQRGSPVLPGGAGSRAGSWDQGEQGHMISLRPPARDPAPPVERMSLTVPLSRVNPRQLAASNMGHYGNTMEKGGRGRERERVSVLTSHSRAGHCNRPSNQLPTMLVVSPVVEEAAKLLLNHETKSMHYCNPPTATTPSSAWMEPESCIWSQPVRRQLLIS